MPVSDNTFTNRINFLVREQGIDRQARQYGVTRRTIRRWQGGETRPSNRVRESVRRRGLTAGSPTAEVRRIDGRFAPAQRSVDTSAFNANAAINRGLRRRRNAAIRDAQARGNTRAERMARALPQRLSRIEEEQRTEEYVNLRRGQQIESLEQSGISLTSREATNILGEAPEEYENWDEWWDDYEYDYDDWETWRSNYEQQAG